MGGVGEGVGMSHERAVRAIPLRELGMLGMYLGHCLDRGMRPRTILAKYRLLSGVAATIGGPLDRAAALDLVAWWQDLRRRQVSDCTRSIYLSHVRSFYAWLVMEGHRDDDPVARIRFPLRRRRQPRDVDPRRVLAVADRWARGSREWWALQLMLRCGLRCCEACAVRPSTDLVDRGDVVVLRVIGKGGHERVVPVPSILAQAAAAGDGWLFPSERSDSGHWEAETMSRFVAATLRAAGLDATGHQLRHTFATAAYAATGDVIDLQKVLGHASVATTQVYVRSLGSGVAGVIDGMFGPTSVQAAS